MAQFLLQSWIFSTCSNSFVKNVGNLVYHLLTPEQSEMKTLLRALSHIGMFYSSYIMGHKFARPIIYPGSTQLLQSGMGKLTSLSVLGLEGHFPFVQSAQSVLEWILRTGSGQNGPAHGSEPLSSPAPVGQIARIYKVVMGKKSMNAPSIFPFQFVRTR